MPPQEDRVAQQSAREDSPAENLGGFRPRVHTPVLEDAHRLLDGHELGRPQIR